MLIGALLALVLVPFFLFEDLSNAVTRWMLDATRSPIVLAAGVAALLAVDVVLPVPSSIVSTGAGALLGAVGGTLTSAAGMTAGCAGGYWLGHRLGRTGATRVVGAAELARAEGALTGFKEVALLVCRPVPVLAEASVIAAGTLRVPFPRFIAVVTVANVVVSAWYAAIGSMARDRTTFVIAFLVAAILPALALLGRKWWTGRGQR